MSLLHQKFHQWWYKKTGLTPAKLLLPFTFLYHSVQRKERLKGQVDATTKRYSVPIIVVGNITLGGAGKTPFCIALVKFLAEKGLNAGVVSRGYGGTISRSASDSSSTDPQMVFPSSDPKIVGDEPVLIAQQCACPIAVHPDRNVAVDYVLAATSNTQDSQQLDLIICDDGLQHYSLPRDIEIAIVDAELGLGNGLLIPAGPLREKPERLEEVDFVVLNGESSATSIGFEGEQDQAVYSMRLEVSNWRNITTGAQVMLPQIPLSGAIHAVAGIANPMRFFNTLERLDIQFEAHPFKDHHAFTKEDLSFGNEVTVVMTAKDAVKCSSFATDQFWSLDVEAQLAPELLSSIYSKVCRLIEQKRDT